MFKYISILFSLAIFCSEIYAQQQLSELRISLTAHNSSLKEVLVQLNEQYKINFIYSDNILPADKKITLQIKEKSLDEVLKILLKNTELQYKLSGENVLIGKKKIDRTLNGYVEDAKTGERLIQANLYDYRSGRGTISNVYGFFSITLPEDSVDLRISYIGYKTQPMIFFNSKDSFTIIRMEPSLELQEVVVTKEHTAADVHMSAIDIPAEQLKKIPSMGGEPDLLKNLHMLPGVQSGNEGSSGLYIRGGGPDQNLILLDGVPVYNVTHLFGFFSIFNSDAINNVRLLKGGFPARYGGRLSGVVDIRMKEGNMKEFHGDGSIGMIASRFTLEGPIKKDKTSFMISGRRTYLDLLAKSFFGLLNANDSSNSDFGIGYYFYDLNAKINHIFSEKDRIYLSFYNGRDHGYMRSSSFTEDTAYTYENIQDLDFGWGNILGALRWNHIFGNKIFSNTTFTYSRYRFTFQDYYKYEKILADGTTYSGESNSEIFSGVEDISAKFDLDYAYSPVHYFRTGGYFTYHIFNPQTGSIIVSEMQHDSSGSFSENIPAIESAIYLEDDISISEKTKLNAGFHLSLFNVNSKTYTAFQPRIALRYLLTQNISLKASYAQMAQYIHLLSNAGIGLPTDLWVPPTDKILPQYSWQVSAGAAADIRQIELSLEGYYKKMRNLLEYDENRNFLSPTASFEEAITSGDGYAYGAELLLLKKTGKLTGWIGYGLSRTIREFPELNDGKPFPYRYDRRHDFSLAISYDLGKHTNLNVNWVYSTGIAVTLPEEEYLTITDPDVLSPYESGPFITSYNFGERNSYRIPPYHRLDVGITFSSSPEKKIQHGMSMGLYNLYNRKNIYFIKYNSNPDKGRKHFTGISYFPVLPMFSYNIKF